jgi:hypothetical protein
MRILRVFGIKLELTRRSPRRLARNQNDTRAWAEKGKPLSHDDKT